MHYFRYKKNNLYCENVSIASLARKFGTPLYIYSGRTILEHFRKIKKAFKSLNPLVCYSVKANSNLSILKSLVRAGAGLDIVSGGELFRALKVKCPPERIVYASVGKTDWEIEEAIKEEILFFNIESPAELQNIDRIAKRLGKKVNVALRINPDVEPKTHKFITTGKLTNKFGIDLLSAEKIILQEKKFSNLNIKGLHIHIGSQITESAPFVSAIGKMAKFIKSLRKKGVDIEYLNIGGGLGIIYHKEEPQTASEFAKKVLPLLKKLKLKVIMEPGRFIVGSAGVLATKVLYIKKTSLKNFIVVDGAMNDLIRPALYQAYHQILPVSKILNSTVRRIKSADIVGPICETGDCLGKKRIISTREGEYLAVFGAGAYGFSMSSNYNSRLRAAEILVKGNKAYLIGKRETYKDLIAREIII